MPSSPTLESCIDATFNRLRPKSKYVSTYVRNRLYSPWFRLPSIEDIDSVIRQTTVRSRIKSINDFGSPSFVFLDFSINDIISIFFYALILARHSLEKTCPFFFFFLQERNSLHAETRSVCRVLRVSVQVVLYSRQRIATSFIPCLFLNARL